MATVTLAAGRERNVGMPARIIMRGVAGRLIVTRFVLRRRDDGRAGTARRKQNHGVSYAEFDALPTAPTRARHHAIAVLSEWRLLPEAIETAELLVSELVTNARAASGHDHGQPGKAVTDQVSLTLSRLADRLVIEVADSNPDPPVPADPDTEAENGRGLMLVQALSKEWGHFLLPAGGKVVYCVISTSGTACGTGGAIEGSA